MEFNSALPFPKERPLKACLNHFPIPVISRSPWRAFRQIHNFGIIQGFLHSMRLGCRAALWPAPGRRQTSADSPSQRGSDPARQRCSNSTLPRRQGAKRKTVSARRPAPFVRGRGDASSSWAAPLRSVSSTSAHPTGNAPEHALVDSRPPTLPAAPSM